MSDTQTHGDTETDAVEEAERQRVRDSLAAFRAGLEALDATDGADCTFLYVEILEALVEGQRRIADHIRSYTYFVEDLWPDPIGAHAVSTGVQATACAYAVAAMYGQVTAIPEDPNKSLPISKPRLAA